MPNRQKTIEADFASTLGKMTPTTPERAHEIIEEYGNLLQAFYDKYPEFNVLSIPYMRTLNGNSETTYGMTTGFMGRGSAASICWVLAQAMDSEGTVALFMEAIKRSNARTRIILGALYIAKGLGETVDDMIKIMEYCASEELIEECRSKSKEKVEKIKNKKTDDDPQN